MILVGDKLLSEEIFDKQFACDLNVGKGACCIEGEGGAPLTEEECAILDEIFDEVKPYLSEEGLKEIEQTGLFTVGQDGGLETPLLGGRACVYATKSPNGTLHCGIEQAFREGKTSWEKPISCHLYPIRIKELVDFTALNYHKWSICEGARVYGAAKDISVLEFCKEALVRRFGLEWYAEAVKTYEVWKQKKQ
ncbi:MAG: hypothetical protein CL847_03845 [Crocinitomicaceae bacterium]|nr:hypothetical protein [Crocinitomicaceae bacterium]|tara:strand:+ start:1559 stop:2137 length:579 start_codon:yes stop_codon:yes gene_type:complete